MLSRRAFALLGVLATSSHFAQAAEGGSSHAFSFTAIEGDPLPMSEFEGKAVLVVNTASRCGFTSQYKGLQALHEAYKDKGLVVLGVPSGDFRQELATSGEVKNFCEMTYGIDFPMTEIESVTGAKAHPLFKWMAAQGETPSWNFHKFLIDRNGGLVAHNGSSTRPDSAALVSRIEDVLAD